MRNRIGPPNGKHCCHNYHFSVIFVVIIALYYIKLMALLSFIIGKFYFAYRLYLKLSIFYSFFRFELGHILLGSACAKPRPHN